MKIISLNHELDTIVRIPRQLGLWKQHPETYETKTKAPAKGSVVLDDFDDGQPRHEEPAIMVY